MLKSTLLCGVAMACGICAATAADLPTRKDAPVPAPYVAPFTWTGFYIGGNIGYGWSAVNPGSTTFYEPIGIPVGQIPGLDYHMGGVIGGGQVGYNYQVGSWVLGLEADISGTGINGSVADTVNNYTVDSNIEWLSTERGRVGFAFDRLLAYATGGLAIGDVHATLNDVYQSGVVTTNSSATYVGWTVGAGLEWAMMQNVSFRAEYLYVDLGSRDQNFNEPPGGWPRIQSPNSVTANIVRLGVNYHF